MIQTLWTESAPANGKNKKQQKQQQQKKKQKSNFVNKSTLSGVIGNNKSTLRTDNTLSSGKKTWQFLHFCFGINRRLEDQIFHMEKDTFFHFSNLVLKASVIR